MFRCILALLFLIKLSAKPYLLFLSYYYFELFFSEKKKVDMKLLYSIFGRFFQLFRVSFWSGRSENQFAGRSNRTQCCQRLATGYFILPAQRHRDRPLYLLHANAVTTGGQGAVPSYFDLLRIRFGNFT